MPDYPKTLDEAIPPGLTPAAQAERKRFLMVYEERLKKLRQSTALTILVWGPGLQSASKIAQKRAQIRDELIRQGHNAMFSEEVTDIPGDFSEKFKEYIQAAEAHLILILLEGSPGALAEAHDFCNKPELATKIFVMVPEEYKEGYSAKGALQMLDAGYGGVYWYDKGAPVRCDLLSRSVIRANARRDLIAMEGNK